METIKGLQEGGLYIDMNRYVDIPLSEIIKKDTQWFCLLF